MYQLQTEAFFDSAHFLDNYYGKCENLHGHRWRIVATISAHELQSSGTTEDMVMDFGEFKKLVRAFAKTLDHTFLVEEGTLKDTTIKALESEGFRLTILPFRTTAENLAHYIFEQLKKEGLPISMVEVDETPNNRAFFKA